MARAWAIVNPAAGKGRAGREWPALAQALAAAGVEFAPCVTCGPGDAALCAREALAEGAGLLIVVGGDGTLHEVVNGCLRDRREGQHTPTLALLPAGTGSDFARTLGIRTSAMAIEVLVSGVARPIDVGRIEYHADGGERGERFFVNVADFGLGKVTNEAVARAPRLPGPAAYLYGALVSIAGYTPAAIHLAIDGETAYTGPAGMLAIGNGRYFGGGMRIAPKAYLDDGQFDIGVMEGVSRRELVTGLLPRVYRGTHLRHEAVHLFRGASLSLTAAGPFALQADGEILGHAPAHVALLPGALRVMAPAETTVGFRPLHRQPNGT